MQNIIFTLNETDDKTMDKLGAFAAINDYDFNFLDNDEEDAIYDIVSLTLFYNTNYTIKGIVQILQYYGIYKGKNKLIKDNIISGEDVWGLVDYSNGHVWLDLTHIGSDVFESNYKIVTFYVNLRLT